MVAHIVLLKQLSHSSLNLSTIKCHVTQKRFQQDYKMVLNSINSINDKLVKTDI